MARFRQTRTNRQTLKVELQGTPPIVGYIEAKIVRGRVTSYTANIERGPERTFRVNPSEGARSALKEAKLWIKAEMGKDKLVLCETRNAISTHVRWTSQPGTLCGMPVGWDLSTPLSIEGPRCRKCQEALKKLTVI